MLSSLQIKNFRLFEELTLPQVGQVNLIVGKNNSGKTCLLEALRIFAGRGAGPVLHSLVEERHEDFTVLSEQADEAPYFPEIQRNPLRSLFPGHEFPDSLDTKIEIGPLRPRSERFRLGLRAYSVTEYEDGLVRKPIKASTLREVANDAKLFLEGRADGSRTGPLIPLDGPFIKTGKERNEHARFVAASGWDGNTLTRRWARVSIRPALREHVISALKLVDPGIQELVLVPGPQRSSEFIVIHGEDERLPLKALDDGAGRLFQMVLATVVSKGGYVLLDEFENGLHWSVQPQVWRLVFKLAEMLDLQVFATTHSWDCVRAFQEADAGSSVTGMLFHLGRSVRTSEYGKVIATRYSGEDLSRATRAGLEVR
ncbi:MAG: AAA family ATPase [Gammaproteobacteria bacterium]|nr:AAA family ATPase [Gammaproteobacteria bacterium]